VKNVSGESVRGLLQDSIPDRLCATTRVVRHNVKSFVTQRAVSQMLVHSILDIFVCCMPTVSARSRCISQVI
jgi:hypothetical protein